MILKGLCLVLGAFFVWQLLGALRTQDPLSNVTMPPPRRSIESTGGTTSNTPAPLPISVVPKTTGVNVASSSITNASNVSTTSAPAVVVRASPTAVSSGVPAPGAAAGTPRSGATKPPVLAGVAQGWVDKIKDSEVFGAAPKPLPMALLGIAGPDVIIRTATGQTGLLREGEELSGVKLLRVGTNRVLIEHEGQRKELTLFSGFGSESLLP
jgi:hypothetical protein